MGQHRQLIGLFGVLVAAIAVGFNDQVIAAMLQDLLGAKGVGHDAGTWIKSLCLSAEVVGMAVSPWLLVTFNLRRFAVFATALNVVTTVAIPFATSAHTIDALRVAEGLAGGFTIPLLMTTALRVTAPEIRLYDLAVYALIATFTPGLGPALAALWTDVIGRRFIFLQAIPLGALAPVLEWYGLPQDRPDYRRFARFDCRGMLLLTIGFGSLTTLLQQGDRLDCFASPTIVLLGLASVIAVPLLLVNEWFHELPLLMLQMFGRRHFLYGTIALFTAMLIGLWASKLPLTFLVELHGYQPLQAFGVIIPITLAQFVMLPLLATVLDNPRIDARLISFLGLACILLACVGCAGITPAWNREQFYVWQLLQAVGQPMVVIPRLMIATNSVVPQEGPYVSAMVNTPRVLAEATGIWLLGLLGRWWGGLHRVRLADTLGQNWFVPQMSDGQRTAFAHDIAVQAKVLTFADGFRIMAALTVALMVLLVLLPERMSPPRLHLASA